jgi:O-antigen/teichoic acid export membrane protein
LGHRLEGSPLASRLARGSFWSLAGSVISRVLGLASAILAARIIGKASYGQLGVVQSTVAMFAAFAGFGMGTTATKFVAEFRATNPGKAGRIIALSSVISWSVSGLLAVVLLFAAPWMCSRVLAAPQMTGCLRVSALLLLLSGVNGAQNGALCGFEAFKRMAAVNLIAGVLNFPLVITGAMFFGLSGVVWGMVFAQAAGCLLNYQALRSEAARHNVPMGYSSWTSEAPVIWRFSLPATLGGLMISPVSWACAALLVRQPHGFDHMGAFNAANQWFGALMWLPYMLGSVLLPMLAEQFSARDKARSGKLLVASVKINAGVTFPLVLGGCLLSPYIMMAYGKGFGHEWPTLVVTLLTAGLLAVEVPVGEVIAASGRMWVGFFMNLGWSLAALTATWLLLPWGATGFASARLLAYAVHAIWTFAYATRIIRQSNE